MRTAAILILATGFIAAVLLPGNEIGTHGLPAIGAKVVAKAKYKSVEPPAKSGPVAYSRSVEMQVDATFRPCEAVFWRSVRTAGNVQLNVPLLI
jgi:hypothetical protein